MQVCLNMDREIGHTVALRVPYLLQTILDLCMGIVNDEVDVFGQFGFREANGGMRAVTWRLSITDSAARREEQHIPGVSGVIEPMHV